MDTRPRYLFGGFEIQPLERRLLAQGAVTPITARAFDLLVALVERAGELVGKDELLALVWPGLVVEESNLAVQVSTLRKLLQPGAIETIPGRGYRFLPKVTIARGEESRPAGNLPRSMTSFIGSRDSVDRSVAALGDTRLLTITGIGGVGKSRLLLETAAARVDDYLDGAWVVDVSAVSDSAGLPRLVANVLGVDDASESGLARHVEDRCMLLLLDNCEHLLRGAANLATRLLQASPRLKVLASTRERLRVSGESTLRLDPLPVPGNESATPDALDRVDSVRLFMEHAAAARPGFALTADNAPSVARICRELEGIPLAIVLAAPLVRGLSPSEIARRLVNPLELLKAADPTVAPRHRTLRASLDWSYDLLAPIEQRCLAKLASLPCEWTFESAAAVWENDPEEGYAGIELLGRLVEKSVVLFDGRRGRYRMPAIVRHHLRERTGESGGA